MVVRGCEVTRTMLETQLEVKDQLIGNLEDIIDEQEARMFQLEKRSQTGSNSVSSDETRGAKRIAAECGRLIDENRQLMTAFTAEQKRRRTVELEIVEIKKGAENVRTNLQPLLEKNRHLEDNVSTALAQLSELQNERRINAELNEEVSALKSRLKEIDEANEKSNRGVRMVAVCCDGTTQTEPNQLYNKQNLQNLMQQLGNVKIENKALRGVVTDLVRETKVGLEKVADQTTLETAHLLKRYKQEISLRRHYHNELVELRGNIRTICRVRPPINCEDRDSTVLTDSFDPSLISVLNADGRLRSFRVDKSLDADTEQEQVFEEVRQLITSCTDGYNVCIFAYGHTGSGKTYTMEGPPDKPGINRRALEQLFEQISNGERRDWNFQVDVSLVEIYNEALRDLLDPGKSAKLNVRMDDRGRLDVPGLTQVAVTCLQDITDVLTRGSRNRTTSATNANATSSRSHAILRANVSAHHSATGQRYFGRLNLVDLAGSERVSVSGACGGQLVEARNINRSLSELGNVVNALKNKQQHVPFRNSQLTRFLEDSLSGDSKTAVIVQVAPGKDNAAESISSLNFAEKICRVELGNSGVRRSSSSATVIDDNNPPRKPNGGLRRSLSMRKPSRNLTKPSETAL